MIIVPVRHNHQLELGTNIHAKLLKVFQCNGLVASRVQARVYNHPVASADVQDCTLADSWTKQR